MNDAGFFSENGIPSLM